MLPLRLDELANEVSASASSGRRATQLTSPGHGYHSPEYEEHLGVPLGSQQPCSSSTPCATFSSYTFLTMPSRCPSDVMPRSLRSSIDMMERTSPEMPWSLKGVKKGAARRADESVSERYAPACASALRGRVS